MNYGTSCQFVCNSGYAVQGTATQCLGGSIIPQTCTSVGSSCALTAPLNGQLGACSNVLVSGNSCTATCNTGYQSIGNINVPLVS